MKRHFAIVVGTLSAGEGLDDSSLTILVPMLFYDNDVHKNDITISQQLLENINTSFYLTERTLSHPKLVPH